MTNSLRVILLTVFSYSTLLVHSFTPYSTKVLRPALGLPIPSWKTHTTSNDIFKCRTERCCPLSMAQSIPSLDDTNHDTSLTDNNNEDPLMLEYDLLTHMDRQGWINTGIMIGLGIFIMSDIFGHDNIHILSYMRGWNIEEIATRTIMDIWNKYYDILMVAPIQTKAVTSATVYTIGDIIAQSTEGKHMDDLDHPRIIRSMLAGLIGHGPLSHYWYQYSETFFNDILHWTEWWSFFPKVMVDQLTWGPFWNNCYILMLGVMKLDSLENIWSEMKRTTVPLVVSGLKLWPLAHCVTYGLVPVENRLLWVDFVEILWVTILATQAAGGTTTTATAAATATHDNDEVVMNELQQDVIVKTKDESFLPKEPVFVLNSVDDVGMIQPEVDIVESNDPYGTISNMTAAYETLR